MLAKNPELRFQQTNNVIEALLPFLEPGASQSPQSPVTPISQAYEVWLAARLEQHDAAPGASRHSSRNRSTRMPHFKAAASSKPPASALSSQLR